MDDFRLKVLCSVAQNHSFTKASHELHVTQPVISKYIQELEQEYNVVLFDRSGNSAELTDAGRLLLTHARAILDSYHAMDTDMHMMSAQHAGVLRVGASHTIAQYLLPAYMATFSAKFKHVKLSLITGSTDEIEQAVEEGRIDLGMVERGTHNNNLRYTPFMRDELVLVATTSGEWSQTERITLDELMSLPLVVGECYVSNAHVTELLHAQCGIRLPQHNITTLPSNAESVKRYISHAHCPGIVSRQAAMQEIKMGLLKVIEIEGIRLDNDFYFARCVGNTSSVSRAFINYMQVMLQ